MLDQVVYFLDGLLIAHPNKQLLLELGQCRLLHQNTERRVHLHPPELGDWQGATGAGTIEDNTCSARWTARRSPCQCGGHVLLHFSGGGLATATKPGNASRQVYWRGKEVRACEAAAIVCVCVCTAVTIGGYSHCVIAGTAQVLLEIGFMAPCPCCDAPLRLNREKNAPADPTIHGAGGFWLSFPNSSLKSRRSNRQC